LLDRSGGFLLAAERRKKKLMRKLIFVFAVLIVTGMVADSVLAQVPDPRRSKATVENSGHDMRVDPIGAPSYAVCSYCHTAHQTVEANAVDPLWNHELSTATYGVYESYTMDATPEELGGLATASNLCLSCHDGTVAVNALYSNGAGDIFMSDLEPSAVVGGGPNGLTDDHPVNFIYDAARAIQDGGVIEPFSTRWVDAGENLPLYDSRVQCATCHDAHAGGGGPFLRRRDTGTATVCLDCHA
jgi:predicted CXXCH cytochrome family protein